MSIPKVKIAVLKNLLIFGEKYLPQSVHLLEGGWVEMLFGRMPFEHAVSFRGASLIGQQVLVLPVADSEVLHSDPLPIQAHIF